MGKVPVEAKRNVTLIGHHGSGKTHLVDSLLFNVGMIDRTGIFVTDNEEIEKERKATFSLGVTGLEYKNTRINIVDTPGMPDFHAETVNGIYASENILLVLNATAGMEIQSERFGAVAKELSKGIIVFFNMMDKDRAEYEAALSDIKETFERSPVLLQLPIGTAAEFKGVIDLIEGKAYIYDNGKPQVQELPDDLKDQYEEARTRMIEDIVETDEELMEKYFEGEEITTEEIKRALKTAYINNQIIPVLFGSALKNIGTDRLLETIVDLGKNPAEGGKWPAQLQSGEEIEISPVENEPLPGTSSNLLLIRLLVS